MPKQSHRELAISTLEKLLFARATLIAERLRYDTLTEEDEHTFDQCLLSAVTRLGVSIEVHDPVRGTVELYQCGAARKVRRWMRPREWGRCRKAKPETLKLITSIDPVVEEAEKQCEQRGGYGLVLSSAARRRRQRANAR